MQIRTDIIAAKCSILGNQQWDVMLKNISKNTIFNIKQIFLIFLWQMELPCGLTNLGNTCYMNATVQCIRSVPELKEALKR